LPAETAIPHLMAAHADRVYRFAVGMCGSSEDAEDVVQETFLMAFRKWHQFEGRSSPATWLHTIASRVCKRMHRRRAGEPRAMVSFTSLLPTHEDDIPDVPAPQEGPLDAVVRQEAMEAVEDAIGTVPQSFRQPFVLKELADFSISEIADILGLKESTVRTRIHRARLLVRKGLAQRLPKRQAPSAEHPRPVCLDLLRSKQEALDRGVAFPLPEGELCSRCQALFATLDLAHAVCADIARGALPDRLRKVLEEDLLKRG
jgi:RNA polymerase sigma-70 factor (ECF subfamily)